jgi:hypothetical protein
MLRRFDGDIRPDVDSNGVPWCSEASCPKFDGKRCLAVARHGRQDAICEPAVIQLQAFIDEIEWTE